MDKRDDLVLRLTRSLKDMHEVVKKAEIEGFPLPKGCEEKIRESHIQYHIARNHLNMAGLSVEEL
jgi:hypothetical protein